MSRTKKFLEGELRFVEGQTSVDGFLKTIASELVKKDWVDYKKNRWDAPWSFDENREIELGDSFRKDQIKLFKSIATVEILPSGIAFGRIKVITGVTSESEKAINITLNGLSYNVTLSVGDDRVEVASKIEAVVKLIEGFEGTKIDPEDNTSVIVTGEIPVFSLETDADVMGLVKTELVTISEVTDGIATGTIVVLSDGLNDGNIKITINGEVITLPIVEGHSSLQIARAIRDRIIAMGGDFKNTTALENVVTISGNKDVDTLTVDSDDTQLTNTKTTVQGGFGIIDVISEARESGDITITLNGSERIVPIIKGDTPVNIAQKIWQVLSSLTGFTLTNAQDATITVAGSVTVESLKLDTDILQNPVLFTDSTSNSALHVGKIEIITPATQNQILEVNVNGSVYNVNVSAGDSTNIIARKIRDVLVKDSPFGLTSYVGNLVTVGGLIEVFSVGTTSDVAGDRPFVISTIETGGLNMAKVQIIQGVEEDVSIVVTVNDDNYVIPILATDSTDEIATKINVVLELVEGLEDTVVEGSIIDIEGSTSVDYVDISATEIPAEDFDIFDNIVKGIGDESSGTMVGDNVLIKVIYGGEEFQRVAFLEEGTPSGDSKNIARLKSRPKGDIQLHEDTILIVENEILQQRGEGIYYSFGKFPISKSQGAHKLELKRDSVVIPNDEYEVDYFNGTVFFKKANLSTAKITASYGACVGIAGEEVPVENYRIINDMLVDTTPTGELKNLDVVVTANYFWELAYPQSLVGITNSTERIVLRTRVDATPSRNKSHKKNYYWELRHSQDDENKYLTGLECRFGTALDGSRTTLDNNTSSVWARFAWYTQENNRMEVEPHLKGWLPVHYQMNFTQEYLNIVVQGSPSVDVAPYDQYLISHAYIGALEGYTGAKTDDVQYNFGMTVGGDELFKKGEFPKDWGQRTGTCVTDITMERTGDGVPYQAHYPSFHTSPEFMDKHFIGESEYTGSNHFSEIIATHPVQRERGKMQGILVGDRSSIHHLDTLISNKDKFNTSGVLLNEKGRHFSACGGANESKEKKWVMFNINSPYWFMNNSPNVFYGIALRKS